MKSRRSREILHDAISLEMKQEGDKWDYYDITGKQQQQLLKKTPPRAASIAHPELAGLSLLTSSALMASRTTTKKSTTFYEVVSTGRINHPDIPVAEGLYDVFPEPLKSADGFYDVSPAPLKVENPSLMRTPATPTLLRPEVKILQQRDDLLRHRSQSCGDVHGNFILLHRDRACRYRSQYVSRQQDQTATSSCR